MNRCLCWALLVLMFAACALAACADEPVTPGESTEAQRFQAEKQRVAAEKEKQQRAALSNYVTSAKHSIDRAWKDWHPPAHGKLLITKVKVTLDSDGKIAACEIVKPSGLDQEDKSVQECLATVSFGSWRQATVGTGSTGHFPHHAVVSSRSQSSDGPDTLDFFWTLMSDGTMNMVEFTDSPEANSYYTNLLGGVPSLLLVSPSGGIRADVDPYMADLQRRIKRAWFPPKGNEVKRVVVRFRINKGGELSNLSIEHSSGLAIADQAALKAIENAAPYRPLPAGSKDHLDIQFTFDYNVFGGGGHGVILSF